MKLSVPHSIHAGITYICIERVLHGYSIRCLGTICQKPFLLSTVKRGTISLMYERLQIDHISASFQSV